MKVKELKIGDGESDKSFPRGGFGVTAVFLLALSLMPKFLPHFFLTGVCPVGRG